MKDQIIAEHLKCRENKDTNPNLNPNLKKRKPITDIEIGDLAREGHKLDIMGEGDYDIYTGKIKRNGKWNYAILSPPSAMNTAKKKKKKECKVEEENNQIIEYEWKGAGWMSIDEGLLMTRIEEEKKTEKEYINRKDYSFQYEGEILEGNAMPPIYNNEQWEEERKARIIKMLFYSEGRWVEKSRKDKRKQLRIDKVCFNIEKKEEKTEQVPKGAAA